MTVIFFFLLPWPHGQSQTIFGGFLSITLATWAVTDNLWRISVHFQRVDAVMQGVIMAEDSPRVLLHCYGDL